MTFSFYNSFLIKHLLNPCLSKLFRTNLIVTVRYFSCCKKGDELVVGYWEGDSIIEYKETESI